MGYALYPEGKRYFRPVKDQIFHDFMQNPK